MNDVKQKQLQIIKKCNVNETYSLNIQNEDDIKTLKEIVDKCKQDDFYKFTPDLDKKDLDRAIIHGRIVVYSNKNIENGTFITPSYETLKSLFDKPIFSKKVKIDNIAWLDVDKGIYTQLLKEE